MNRENLIIEISNVLFGLDPMNTSCKENDMFDEYDAIADGILLKNNHMSLEEAIEEVFLESFESTVSAEDMKSILAKINPMMQVLNLN